MKSLLLTLFIVAPQILIAGPLVGVLKDLSQLETIVKSNHFECFSEKDTAEVYRRFRLFYENKITECKNSNVTTTDFKVLLKHSLSCRSQCTCSVILDYAESEKLSKSQRRKLVQLVAMEAEQMKTKDYEKCFSEKLSCTLPIVKKFNEASLD